METSPLNPGLLWQTAHTAEGSPPGTYPVQDRISSTGEAGERCGGHYSALLALPLLSRSCGSNQSSVTVPGSLFSRLGGFWQVTATSGLPAPRERSAETLSNLRSSFHFASLALRLSPRRPLTSGGKPQTVTSSRRPPGNPSPWRHPPWVWTGLQKSQRIYSKDKEDTINTNYL